MPSIVSPVKQNVPVRWRPLRPMAVANDACTRARRWACPLPLGKLVGNGVARIIRSIESILFGYIGYLRRLVSDFMVDGFIDSSLPSWQFL